MVYVRFWAINWGNQPCAPRNESRVSPKGYPAKKNCFSRGVDRVLVHTVHNPMNKYEAVPRPKLGLFFYLELLQIFGVRFWLVGSNSNWADGQADC